MITLNKRDCEWVEGLTVEALMQNKNFTYSRIIVSVNGKIIPDEEYSTTFIHDHDEVKAIHLLAGG